MQNLNFNEGYKEYSINGDENRVIRISTTDYSIIDRMQKAEEAIQEKVRSYEDLQLNPDGTSAEDTQAALEAVSDLTEFINRQINFIFNADIADTVFNGQSCLSTYNGVPLFERFIDCVVPVIEKDLKEERKVSEDRIRKYTDNGTVQKYKKTGDEE